MTAERNGVADEASIRADREVRVRRVRHSRLSSPRAGPRLEMPHAGVTVSVAVRPIWADGVGPDHVLDGGPLEFGPGELGIGEIGPYHVGALQIGAAQVSSGEIGVLQVGAAKIAVDPAPDLLTPTTWPRSFTARASLDVQGQPSSTRTPRSIGIKGPPAAYVAPACAARSSAIRRVCMVDLRRGCRCRRSGRRPVPPAART